jgi:hypothetical protein
MSSDVPSKLFPPITSASTLTAPAAKSASVVFARTPSS